MSIATMAPLAPVMRVHRLASELFCGGGWRALQAVALCRQFGPFAVLDALQAERHRAETAGTWGNYAKFRQALDREALASLQTHPRRRAKRRASADPARAQRGTGGL